MEKQAAKNKSRGLFGSSGIRGVFGSEVTPELALRLGRALVSLGFRGIAIASDTRITSSVLKHALISGLLSGGASLTDFEIAPTPALCWGTRELGMSASVMITASHNPADYNGFKVWDNEGRAIPRTVERKIEEMLIKGSFPSYSWESASSSLDYYDVSAPYTERIIKEAASLKGGMRVVVDAANGAARGISSLILRRLNYDVTAINDVADGRFPNRQPEPNPQNLSETSRIVREKGASIGFCHDGDADRLVVIDEKGEVCNFDRFLAWLSLNMARESGIKRIVTTVDASMIFERIGLNVIRTRVGDVDVANKLYEAGGAFGGEPSGSFIFPKWGFWPDGIFAIIKTLKFLEEDGRPLSVILSELPESFLMRSKVRCGRDILNAAMEKIREEVPEGAQLSFVDGIRIVSGDSAVLIRPSGTEPLIRINAEAPSAGRAEELLSEWKKRVGDIISVLGGGAE